MGRTNEEHEMNSLLTREQFKEAVFKRDKGICIVPGCGKPGQDAHHIIERALWKESSELGGYLIDNGATLCGEHHIHAEKNFFPPHACRMWAGITNRILPKQLDPTKAYDKWGVELKQPTRDKIKYPSTAYLPFSPEPTNPIANMEQFVGQPLIITIKMDGSNCCISGDGVAARNGTDAPHKSFDLIKAEFRNSWEYCFPSNYQLFGEWLYAKHSIHYKELSNGYYQIFHLYDKEKQLFLGWDDVESFAASMELQMVPVIKRVTYNSIWEAQADLQRIAEKVISDGHEGIVVRGVYPIHYGQFETHSAKYVRVNHIQTDEHWSNQPIIKNIVK